jgi:hypothetical protein
MAEPLEFATKIMRLKKRSSLGRANAASRGVSLKWFAYLDAEKMKRLHSLEKF